MTTLEQCIGNTPLVQLQRLAAQAGSEVWVKLEGNNPAGSVKDRAALAMIQQAGLRGEIKPGDVLIQPPLSGYGTTDFGRVPQLIDAGYRATTVLAARLAELRKPKDLNSEALDVARTPNQRKPVIDAIRVENNSKVSDE
ncbi:pyridoxal-phosphate dependent enzyme, partial [Escherichia coli]|uniref:pyridoxal-phosphate dependent enzyme n=1 Tax=Escherichia coli TaxID=562 RepID=UPI002025F300